MNVSLYQAAAAMNANSRWEELISQNLGSGAAPGTRKQDMSFSSVEAGLASPGVSGPRYVIPSATAYTNFQPGEMRTTGNALDFAIEGKALFEVQLPSGARGYTRDGEFQLNSQGQLTTKQGYPVMGSNGPIRVNPNNSAPITVSATGDVSQGSETKGRLQIVEFGQPGALTPLSGGLFLADKPEAQPLGAGKSMVRQGFLETGNSSPTVEMASLITSMRMFEANQKVLQAQDDRMGRAITDLGGTN